MNQSAYKAEVVLGYGIGAPLHKYAGGNGWAISNSPKRAVELAERMAERRMRGLVGYEQGCPILRIVTLYQGARLVCMEF